jgi:dienelactone hydrolase
VKTIFLAASALAFSSAFAHPESRVVEYEEGGVVLQGKLFWDGESEDPRPAVMIVHDWDGPDAYKEFRAELLAEMGYAAFVADIYGKGIRPKNPQESGAEARKYYADPALYRRRLAAGVEAMSRQAEVDKAKMAAIGYCFGGSGVLELARSGAALSGIVSFHGGLSTQMPAQENGVKAKVMVVHASQDPSVPREQLSAFLDEMKDAKVDYQLLAYNLNVHAFTKPGGSAYNEDADRRSWMVLEAFLAEVFGLQPMS